MAAGRVPWGVAGALAERGVSVEPMEVNGAPVDVQAILARAAGKSLVVAARNLHVHASEAETVEALLAERPDAVIVEMGWPGWRPPRALAYIATHGSSRVSGIAAAEALRP